MDSFIETLVVFSGVRIQIEQDQIPGYFWPVTGKWKMRGELTSTLELFFNTKIDLHKVFVDDESYNSGHGEAYNLYGIDPKHGAIIIVRPDQCK